MSEKKIHIALHGAPRVGKDTVAGILRERFGFRPAAFADALREEICTAYPGVTPTFLTHPASKESPQQELALKHCKNLDFVSVATHLLGHEQMGRPLPPRWVMRAWGSEFRRQQDRHYWVKKAQELVDDHQNARFVFTDNRFEEETDWLRELGCVFVTIERPEHLRTHAVPTTHISDQYQPPADYTLVNDGHWVKALEVQVVDMVESLNISPTVSVPA